VRPGDLAADHPEPIVLGGEPPPERPGVLFSSCNARMGLSQRRRRDVPGTTPAVPGGLGMVREVDGDERL
jgi:hypothetical protein